MKLSAAISILFATLITSAGAAKQPNNDKNITYNVISLIPNNQTLGVIVDNQAYPLTNINSDSTLFYYGEAPLPTSGKYQYAILDKNNYTHLLHTENFSRTATNITKNTLNEYYGRSWNSFNLTKLPTILPPLPIVNRVKSALHIDGEIPTIHFVGNQTEINTMHHNQTGCTEVYANLTYISPNDVKAFQNISLEISGHSTRGMKKLSYKFKLPKNQDLYGYRTIKLRSMCIDPSYMREQLAYGIANSVGLPTSQYSYVRVYINDQAIGLFGLSEAMTGPWLRNEFGNGSKEFKQGALFVGDPSEGHDIFNSSGNDFAGLDQMGIEGNDSQQRNGSHGWTVGGDTVPSASCDLSFLGNNITLYEAGQYSVKEDPTVGTPNFTRIMDLTRFVSEQPSANVNNSVVSLWQEKIDITSFLRGLAFEIVISDSDAYLTMANNYILYNDLQNERLVFSTQDFDISMGNTMFNVSKIHGGNYTEFPGFQSRPLMSKLLAVPQFKQEFEQLLVNITKELVNPKILGSRIDTLVEMLKEDVVWDKSLPRVGAPILLNELGGGNSNQTNSSSSSDEKSIDIPFHTAINGPTGTNLSMALNEWLSRRSSNLLSFVNQSLPANDFAV